MRIAEANLNIDFEVVFEEDEPNDDGWLAVYVRGARVWVHGMTLFGVYQDVRGKTKFVGGPLDRLDPRPDGEPVQLHRDERAVFEWPGDRLSSSGPRIAEATIHFSIDKQEDASLIRRHVTFPSDDEANTRTGVIW